MWVEAYNHSDYIISNTGSVCRATEHNVPRWPVGRELTPQMKPDGYLRVKLNGNYVYLAGLVAETFICPRPDGLEVNHKNGDKEDNSVENLEWVTHKENIQHAVKNGLHVAPKGENHGNAKLTNQAVRDIRKTPKGTRGLGKKYGVHSSLIWLVRNNKIWTHVA